MRYRLLVMLALLTGLLGWTSGLAWAGAFDPMPEGARAWGMGNAFTAVVNDAYAVYWNPAALDDVRRPQLVMSHMDIQSLGLLIHDQLCYAQPFVFDNSVAVSWVRMGTTGQVNFLNYSENTIIVSYEQPIAEGFSTGVNLKVFQVKSDVTAGGLGLDFGLRWKILPEITLAAFGENLNHPEIIWATGADDRLPVNLNIGIAGHLDKDTIIAVDAQQLVEINPEFHFGAERWFFEQLLALRAGGTYTSHDNRIMWSAGFGLKFSFLEFDYAYGSHYDLDGNHVFSLKVYF